MAAGATAGAAPDNAGVPVGMLGPMGRAALGRDGAPSGHDEVAARLRAVIAALDALDTLDAQYGASWAWPTAAAPRDDVQVEPLPNFRGTIPGTDIPDVGQPEDATAIPNYHARPDVDMTIERTPPLVDPDMVWPTIPQNPSPWALPSLPPVRET
ncbi:MAG TPA: hypothetical protein VMB81_26270 [Candidatus Sulfotelmatobacter sp.]|nr:hypothetical protein [Candidatus Sulfotelmatobacter sp.]